MGSSKPGIEIPSEGTLRLRHEDKGGLLDAAVKVARILSFVAIPLVLGIGSYFVQLQISDQTAAIAARNAELDRMELNEGIRETNIDMAIKMLALDKASKDSSLREAAVVLLEESNAFNERIRNELKAGNYLDIAKDWSYTQNLAFSKADGNNMSLRQSLNLYSSYEVGGNFPPHWSIMSDPISGNLLFRVYKTRGAWEKHKDTNDIEDAAASFYITPDGQFGSTSDK